MAPTSRTKRVSRRRQFTKYVKGRLLERQERLLAKVEAKMRLQDKHRSAEPADSADLAADANDEEMEFRVAEMRSDEIMQIEEALEKISEGAYGICENCGRKISAARLQAMPAAPLCVGCQVEHEISMAPMVEEWVL